jgi:hypothetical protein
MHSPGKFQNKNSQINKFFHEEKPTLLGIPQLDPSVISRRQKLRPRVVEGDVLDSLTVADVSSNTFPISVNLPKLKRKRGSLLKI